VTTMRTSIELQLRYIRQSIQEVSILALFASIYEHILTTNANRWLEIRKKKDDSQDCYNQDMHADMLAGIQPWGTYVRTDRLVSSALTEELKRLDGCLPGNIS
jgi:hypothetical protein